MNDSSKQLKKLNQISPSFCLAKWLQVTIDLVHGTTHSCHHPKRHAVPLEEIRRNSSALHNSEFKKEQRKLMLQGQRPSECSYCWDAEDLGISYSDRFIKSTDDWAWPQLEKISLMPWDQNVVPSYVEVMIDNACNFSCGYCISDISTGVATEMNKFGPYTFDKDAHRTSEFAERSKDKEEYLAAFKDWFVEIVNELKVFRITGGEPFLSKSIWWYFEEIRRANNPDLKFVINTHFSHPAALIEKIAAEANDLISKNKILQFELYVSLDTYGTQAEYIRHGLNYQKVIDNLIKFSELVPKAKIVIMSTFNILSYGSYLQFLKNMTDLKSKMNLTLDISILKNPRYLRADLATADLKERLNSCLQFMKSPTNLFSKHEIEKMQNLVTWTSSEVKSATLIESRKLFYKFVHEYDRRKKTHFREIFPEYKSLLTEAKISFLTHPEVRADQVTISSRF